MDEDDVDDELGLPKELVGVGLKEKRELLQYKQTHNEVTQKQLSASPWHYCFAIILLPPCPAR